LSNPDLIETTFEINFIYFQYIKCQPEPVEGGCIQF
jgi:hypothetical protein